MNFKTLHFYKIIANDHNYKISWQFTLLFLVDLLLTFSLLKIDWLIDGQAAFIAWPIVLEFSKLERLRMFEKGQE